MIVLYLGAQGRGKTLTMVKDMYKYKLNGWKVYSNFYVPFRDDEITKEDILNMDGNSELWDCVIAIDEVQVYFDSREFMKNNNKKFSNFIQQVRKRGIVLLLTTQYGSQTDVRIRKHVDITAQPKHHQIKIGNEYKGLCEVKYKDLTMTEDEEFLEPPSTKTIYDAEPVYKLFRTREEKR